MRLATGLKFQRHRALAYRANGPIFRDFGTTYSRVWRERPELSCHRWLPLAGRPCATILTIASQIDWRPSGRSRPPLTVLKG